MYLANSLFLCGSSVYKELYVGNLNLMCFVGRINEILVVRRAESSHGPFTRARILIFRV